MRTKLGHLRYIRHCRLLLVVKGIVINKYSQVRAVKVIFPNFENLQQPVNVVYQTEATKLSNSPNKL